MANVRIIMAMATAMLAAGAARIEAQQAYPAVPRSLPEAEEIVLARSAAPEQVSGAADIWVLRDNGYAKAVSGTNGCACIVTRDYHEGSRYPICFDQEGARTLLPRYVFEGNLRLQGVPDSVITRRADEAVARGELTAVSRPLLAYMMSPRQVLFSVPGPEGRRVGAWFPHIMMAGVGITPDQSGLARGYRWIQTGGARGTLHEFVVLVPVWSDGTPAPAPQPPRP